MVPKNYHDWDLKLSLFLLAYLSAVHETTIQAILHPPRCCLVVNFPFLGISCLIDHRTTLHCQMNTFEITRHDLKTFITLLGVDPLDKGENEENIQH